MNNHSIPIAGRRTSRCLAMLACVIGLAGCSTMKIPELPRKIAIPDITIPENHPSFSRRLYAGAGFGNSSLKPDTSGTVFTVSSKRDATSQMRLGIDLHDRLTLELDTGILGEATLAQANTYVDYTTGSLSALIYGLNDDEKRARRVGWSGFARLGVSIVQRASAVIPLDYSDTSFSIGLGAEYGFWNGIALRAEATRFDSDAMAYGIGGIYRFGMAPEAIGQVFVDAAKPALGAAHSRVQSGGRALGGARPTNRRDSARSAYQRGRNTNNSDVDRLWTYKPSNRDKDGDGVLNAADNCVATTPHTLVGNDGCGLFDAVLSEVIFKSGSHWLTPRARGALDTLSTTLLAFPEARVQVRAHTDSTGPADINLGLSARRAEAVVTYLAGLGVAEVQLEAIGLGESQPLDSNETSEGRKRNRRVELLTLASTDPDGSVPGQADSIPVLGAANIDGSAEQGNPISEKAIAEAASIARAVGPKVAEPVFPPMTGVKIEPLPASTYVAGLSIGGLLEGVKFEKDSDRLTAVGKLALASVGEELNRFPEVRIAIMAHTDDKGDEALGRKLTDKQAAAVVKHLVGLGIVASRLEAESYGSTLPLAQNVSESDRDRNRRVEIRILHHP